MSFVTTWLPPVAWMAVVWWLSSPDWSAQHTGGMLLPLLRWLLPWATPSDVALLHGLTRKLAHLTEYGILAALWARALRRGTRAGPWTARTVALAVSVAWAVVDEVHQSRVATRTGSPIDVAIDAAGAVCALVIATTGWRRSVDVTTSVLLWIAAMGGIAALALDRLADVDSGPLWLTTPIAIAVLGLRFWRRRVNRKA